jgi:hypothetical protein
LLLLVICIGAIGGAAFHIWSSDRAARADAAAGRRFTTTARDATTAVADLRAAQEAYVAAGQGEAFWFGRVTAIRAELDEQLADLKSNAAAPDAVAALDAAATALADFTQMDQRARDYTRSGQLTLASDMVFTDGLELTKRAGDALAAAATAEEVARDAAAGLAHRSQAAAAGTAAAIGILGLLLMLPLRARKDAVVATVPVSPARATLSGLDEFRPPPRPAPARQPEPALVNIGGIATLCNDLARISDTRALPSLLERATLLLNATGMIVWIADPDGRELAPILVHGYPPHLATRLGTLARDAENLTASAYRTALLQTVKADAVSSGAIAVPLVGSSGCVGVMAAEMKNGGEQQEHILAAATIVASQLATLVGPPSARAKAEAAG